MQSSLSIQSSEHAHKQLQGLGHVLPTVPAWAQRLGVGLSWKQAHLSLESTGELMPSLSHSLARKISSTETIFVRNCQGTQANIYISFPGITSPFPHSSQTHKHSGSKQWPVPPSSHSLSEFACPAWFQDGLLAVPLPTGKGTTLQFSGVIWGLLGLSVIGKIFAAQRN